LNNLSAEQLLRAVSSAQSSLPAYRDSTKKTSLGGETKSSTTSDGQDMKVTLLPKHVGVREALEWNMAAMQFVKLTGNNVASVTEVEVYESSSLKAKHQIEKTALLKKGFKEERWVFHGTSNENNVPLIMTGGFKVGGTTVGDVPRANGAVYGRGVYTALGPNTPMSYAGVTGRIILARGLLGNNHSGVEVEDVHDSWSPKTDWIIFRRGSQLLPRYVVHFTRDPG
jgi:hypothetical protein